MFPIAKEVENISKTENKLEKPHDLSWLKNPSFIPVASVGTRQVLNQDGNQHIKEVRLSSRSHSPEVEALVATVNNSCELDTSSTGKNYQNEKHVSDRSSERKRKHHNTRAEEKHKYKKKHKSKRKKEKKDTTSDKSHLLSNKTFYDEVLDLKIEDSFRLDNRPDESNWNFDSIYKMNVARRNLLTKHCLSSDSAFHVYLGKHSERKILQNSRYFSKHNAQLLKQLGEKVRCSGTAEMKDTGYEEKSLDFIELSTTTDTASIDVAQKTSGFNVIKEKVEHYNKSLRLNPHDIDKWLQWVAFQPTYVKSDLHSHTSQQVIAQKQSIQRATIDLQLAILDKAIAKNPASIELHIKKLEISQDVSDKEIVIRQWKSLLYKFPNSAELWRSYLSFRCSSMQVFTVPACMKAYAKALHTLRRVVSGQMASHPPKHNTEKEMIGIFVDMCTMLWRTGHTEKAVAIYQGLLEFNLNCPAVLTDTAHEDKLELFEAFWGSSAPRISEDKAAGWHDWVKRKGNVQPCTSKSNKAVEEEFEEDLIKRNTRNEPSLWIALEETRHSRHWMPWRPDHDQGETEEDCEDPDRLVLADDVTPFLFTVSSEELRLEIVCNFLKLLGVDIAHLKSNSLFEHSTEIFPDFRCISIVETTSNEFAYSASVERLVLNVVGQLGECLSKVYHTLLVRLIVRYRLSVAQFQHRTQQAAKQQLKLIKKWIKALLKEKSNRNNLTLWQELANVVWEMGNKVESLNVLITAIQMNVSNSREGEADRGNYKDLRVCSLFGNYVEKQLQVEELSVTTERKAECSVQSIRSCERLLSYLVLPEVVSLSSDLGGTQLSATTKLRTKHAFQLTCSQLAEAYFQKLNANAVNEDECILLYYYGNELSEYLKCHAYWLYCAYDFSAARALYDSVLERLRDCTSETTNSQLALTYSEYVYQTVQKHRLKLCKYHADTNPVSFQIVKQPLLEYLESWPCDSYVLKLFVLQECRAGLARQLRRFLHAKCDVDGHAVLWLYAVIAEMLRLHNLKQYSQAAHAGSSLIHECGISHQVRSWLEAAVTNSQAGYCPLLWRFYIHFEKEQGHMAQAQAVLYRALQRCPTSKAIYMDAVKLCPEKISEFIDMMTENDMRVRTPFEELQLLFQASVVKTPLDSDSHTEKDTINNII